jgi:2-polyprenyl-3-methyl-5-hydroxy-6-metoxy-1,4-benzoquinol methylase
MNLLAPPRRFDPDEPELIDRPGTDSSVLQEELQLLEKLNRRLGGCQLVLQYAQRLFQPANGAPFRILDLGTGSADIPRAIAAWGRQRKLPLAITAVDGNPAVLRIAREACQGWPEIRFEQHDLRALPYAANSHDLVLCSLTLHHFGWADAVGILRRVQEIARGGYIVNDLRRNWAAIWTTELVTRTVIRSQILRHDGPQSCRAAFTVDELRMIAHEAGLHQFQIKRHHGVFRMVLEGSK